MGIISSQVSGAGLMIRGDIYTQGGDFICGDKIVLNVQVAPALELPTPPHDFSGRKTELQGLTTLLKTGHVLISGTGGVGKTALALVLAAQASVDYPDAQLYLDLRGDRPETALAATQVMAQVLHSFDPNRRLPFERAELAECYRRQLEGRRVLLLLDNVAGLEQVQALLPPDGCRLVVTSRWSFEMPGGARLALEALKESAAAEVLLRAAPGYDAGVGHELARACGGLPLSLHLLAAQLNQRPGLSLADLLVHLVGAPGSVTSALQASYTALPGRQQARWRQLAVFPASFNVAAAAAVWDCPVDEAAGALAQLQAFRLLDCVQERYRLHDLGREFAAARLSRTEQSRAAGRHAAWYGHVLAEAERLFLTGGQSTLSGLRLFDAEQINIQTGRAWAAAYSASDRDAAWLCNRYPHAGAHILDVRLTPDEQIIWLQDGVAAIQRLSHAMRFVWRLFPAGTAGQRRDWRQYELAHLGNLGLAHARRGDLARALEVYQQVLGAYRQAGDLANQAVTLTNLGNVYSDLGDLARATGSYQRALELHRQLSDRRGECADLGNLGLICTRRGQGQQASEYYRQALRISRQLGDLPGEALALLHLGDAGWEQGNTPTALVCFEESLAIYTQLGDLRNQARLLDRLGRVSFSLRRLPSAGEYYRQMLALCEQAGERRGQGRALGCLGLVHAELGELSTASEYFQRSLETHRQIGDRLGQAADLTNLAVLAEAQGDNGQAAVLRREKARLVTGWTSPGAY